MNFTDLLNQQLNLLLTDPTYVIPMELEMEIEDQSGFVRDYCTDTDQYLDTQLEWIQFILS